MTDREILINSLQKGVNLAKDKVRGEGEAFSWGDVADYLLANGVIVPTFNCGDRVWFIPKGLDEVCEATVTQIEYNYFTSPQEWIVIDYISSIVGKHKYKSRIDLMLNKTVFLTKEEAEEKLRELGKQ